SRAMLVVGFPKVTVSGVQILDGEIAAEGGTIRGGGIFVNEGELTLDRDLLVGNVLDAGVGGHSGVAAGGAVVSLAGTELTLRETNISDNVARAGATGEALGGGIAAYGTLTVEGGQVKGNTAQGVLDEGGGIFFHGPRAALAGLSLTGNAAEPVGDKGADTYGGGVALNGGSENLIDGVTIAENVADGDGINATEGTAVGGGLEVVGTGTTVVNTTIADNTVTTEVNEGGHAIGGGLSIAGPTKIVNSTISGNSSQASGAYLLSLGGNLYTDQPVSFENSIVAEGTVVGGAGNCATASTEITSEGHNIDSLDDCNFHARRDRVDTDPDLRPLAENGGPVETMALQPDSPAIAAGAVAACPETDARGVLRPTGAVCDIGAFEIATPIATTEPATDVGTADATLSGAATNPDLTPGSVSFQYGTSTAYGSTTPAQPIGATTRTAPFIAAATGLSPDTTYHFRIVVQNQVGTAFGEDQTLTTAPGPTPSPGVGGPAPSGKRPRLTVRHLGGLRFKLRCSVAPCHGRLVATAASGRHRVVVAQAKFDLGVGRTRTLALKLDPAGRRLATRRDGLTLMARPTLRGGGSTPARPLRFRLRPPRRTPPARPRSRRR
ncbi:MAG TPA: choice-of-anchor Q domain-containing protein, partial [Solirubrobacterales bacterium]|nr:choice-of-anchor Q domain-containing protein [Solirubrobacterales bacterium]